MAFGRDAVGEVHEEPDGEGVVPLHQGGAGEGADKEQGDDEADPQHAAAPAGVEVGQGAPVDGEEPPQHGGKEQQPRPMLEGNGHLHSLRSTAVRQAGPLYHT